MSSSTSDPATSPPINPQMQLELEPITINIPPDPGNNSHTPLTNSPFSSNSHSNPQNGSQTVTFGQALHYWWGNAYQDSHSITSLTPPLIWFVQNVYPLVTPMRIGFLSLSLISFLLAYGSFMETEFYKSTISGGSSNHARPLLFSLAATGHTLWLIFLFFFSFCSSAYDRYRHHYLLKSSGELLVMLIVSLLILGIGHKHQELAIASPAASGSSYEDKVNFEQVAALGTAGFLTIDALCIINLLKPGHHYSLLEATATLTLHLGLVGSFYLGIFAVGFIFGIMVIKNFLWRHIGHAEAPTNEHHHLAWVGIELV